MTGHNGELASYRDRWLRIEMEKRERSEDLRELKKEMLGAGVSKDEVAGVALAVRREFESADRRAKRTEAERIADELAASGAAPLFGAAA